MAVRESTNWDAGLFVDLRVFAADPKEIVFQDAIDPHAKTGFREDHYDRGADPAAPLDWLNARQDPSIAMRFVACSTVPVRVGRSHDRLS
jgi:hypothetical protein